MNKFWIILAALGVLILGYCDAAKSQPITNPAPVGDAGAYNTSAPTCTASQFCFLQTDANGNLKVVVTSSAASTGATPFHLVAANSNNSTSLKVGAGTVYSVQLAGIGAAPAYLKFYDKASAPTCASDTVISQFIIPAASTAALGAGSNISIPVGVNFTTGIAFCVVTGIADNDNTSVAAATFVINIDWK